MQPFPRKRTTTGCLTCRMRRKKCDEEKPTCTGCQRNFLICTWPPGSKAGDAVSLTRHAGQKLFTVSNGSVDHVPIRSTASKSTASQPIIAFNAAASTLPHPLAFMPGPRRESDGLLFDHYLQITSMQIAGRVKPRNPFLSHLIPIAYTDAAVFQSLLALSGAQLCAKSSAYEHNARSHYAVTLRSVKHTLLDWRKADARALTGLLTATIMLCFYEGMIGDIHGNFLFHLRASRTILLELRENRADETDPTMIDLLTECYAFFAITANLTLHADLTPSRDIPQDSLLSYKALSSLNYDTDIYGVLFGSAHKLFSLINPITRSARHFLQHPDDEKREAQLIAYETQVLGWKHMSVAPSPNPTQPVGTVTYGYFRSTDNCDAYATAGKIYQQAILIFLYTMFHGPHAPTPHLIAKVDACVMKALMLSAQLLGDSYVQMSLMWTVLIVGSVMKDPVLRAAMAGSKEGRSELPYTMLSVQRGFEFLGLLWGEMEKDDRVYGPYGIELTIRRHNFNLCCFG